MRDAAGVRQAPVTGMVMDVATATFAFIVTVGRSQAYWWLQSGLYYSLRLRSLCRVRTDIRAGAGICSANVPCRLHPTG